MRKILTRRTVLKGSAALGLSAFAASVKGATPDPVAITPDLIEAAKKDGKLILYSSMDLPVGEKVGKAFEAKYPGMRSPDRTLRRRAAVPARRPGISRAAFTPPTSSTPPTLRTSSPGSGTAGWRLSCPTTWRKHFPARLSRPRRHVGDLADLSVLDRVQHEFGKARRRAEEFCGSARPQMGWQDRQGPSGL